MKANKKIIIISAAVLVAGIITFLAIKSVKKRAGQSAFDEPQKAPTNKPKAAPAETGIPGVVFPIKRRTGVDVGMPAEQTAIKNIQIYLNKQLTYQAPLPVNGIYNAATEGYAKAFLKTPTVSYDQYKKILQSL